jgi:predicted RNase H-like HicB family nuclease
MTTERVKSGIDNNSTKTNRIHTPKNREIKVVECQKKMLKLPVIIRPGETGYFIAEVPILPGCLSQGKTREEALINIKDAAELYLDGEPLPEILGHYILTEVEISI